MGPERALGRRLGQDPVASDGETGQVAREL